MATQVQYLTSLPSEELQNFCRSRGMPKPPSGNRFAYIIKESMLSCYLSTSGIDEKNFPYHIQVDSNSIVLVLGSTIRNNERCWFIILDASPYTVENFPNKILWSLVGESTLRSINDFSPDFGQACADIPSVLVDFAINPFSLEELSSQIPVLQTNEACTTENQTGIFSIKFNWPVGMILRPEWVCEECFLNQRHSHTKKEYVEKTFSRENESGWTLTANVIEDYMVWVNEFSATHPTLGWVRGDFESEVTASSEEAYNHFYSHHTPFAFDYADI